MAHRVADGAVMDTTAIPPVDLQRLAEALWQERLVVEQLLYRLTCAKLLLASGEHRFVTQAMDEVGSEVERLHEVELQRARLVQEVGEVAGAADRDLSLDDLVRGTSGPWPRVFGNLRRAFRELAEEIETTTAVNQDLAEQGLLRVRDSLTAMAGAPRPAPHLHGVS